MYIKIEMLKRKSTFIIFASCIAIYTIYSYYNFNEHSSYEFVQITKVNKDPWIKEPITLYNGTEDFLINTTGCYIPNYAKYLVIKEEKNYNNTCGQRAVSIIRNDNDIITFDINKSVMNKYTKGKYVCCYSFVSRSAISGKEDTQLSYTNCTVFKSGTKTELATEIVTVTCLIPKTSKARSTVVYEDSYLFLKKQPTTNNDGEEKSWNVLILGMDTMSRARTMSSMPNTVKYLRKHGWLDYRGYQKIGSNTFPNLMSFLTGKRLDTIYKKCQPTMDECNELIVWNKFRKAGYITAYGEDNLRLPDTFSRYNGFRTPPTHHYTRPFFLTGEKQVGNLICAKHRPSAKHLLDYALDFATAYKDDKFFGMFWINSYSHNPSYIPTLLDKDVINFFERLTEIGLMNNTFVVLLSDHGIRFGSMRLTVHSYYEERLPMFFIWTPLEFRNKHSEMYHNLQLNQNRLITPYDFYITLAEISNSSVTESEACPQCTSLFEEKSANITCTDSGVGEKWCSCHEMTKVTIQDHEVNTSVQIAASYIQNRVKSIKTIKCMMCYSLQLETVLRTHSYRDANNRINYVVAFRMSPGKALFEATVMKDGNEFKIVQPTDTISMYNTRGNCVKNANDRPYCVCKPANCSRLDI